MSDIKVQTSSDIPFAKSFSVDEFDSMVKDFDLVGSLMSLQKLGAFMSNQVQVNINLEFEFHSTPKVKLRAGMLTRDFVAFTTKRILLHCQKQERQYNDFDLTGLIYAYGNLEDGIQKLKDSDLKESGWLWVLRSTYQQWHYLRYYSNIIGRYHWIFAKVFEKNPHFGEKLNEVLGIDVFDAMKIGTCIFANYCPRPNEGFADSFLMESYTNTPIQELRSLLTEANILKLFSIFSVTQKQFQEENKKFELTDSLLKKYEFNALKRFPVIATTSVEKNEQYIIPSQADFLFGVFEGLYYVLLDRLNEEDKATLYKEIGGVFEDYIGTLIKDYGIESISSAKILSEITYVVGRDGWKSADWLLVSDEYIVQIECKKRKIDNYSKAGIQHENGSGIDNLLSDLAKELDKLVKKEKHIRDNKVPGVLYKNQKVINLIVFLDEMFSINKYARDKIKAKMSESSDDFYVFGCWEFELICQQSKNKKQGIVQSVDDQINGKTEIYKIDFLDRVYNEFFHELLKGEKGHGK